MTGSGAAGRAYAGWSGLLHNLTTSGFGVAVQTLRGSAAGAVLAPGSRPDARAGAVPADARRLVGHLLVLGCPPRLAHHHMGPGPFSLDCLLSRGAGTSAGPGAAPLCRAYCWVTPRLGPWYQVAIRVSLADAPAGAAFAATGMSSPMQRSDVAAWLPHVPGMVALLPPSISPLLATLFAQYLAALGKRSTGVDADLPHVVPKQKPQFFARSLDRCEEAMTN
jgi:hypothetical protein